MSVSSIKWIALYTYIICIYRYLILTRKAIYVYIKKLCSLYIIVIICSYIIYIYIYVCVLAWVAGPPRRRNNSAADEGHKSPKDAVAVTGHPLAPSVARLFLEPASVCAIRVILAIVCVCGAYPATVHAIIIIIIYTVECVIIIFSRVLCAVVIMCVYARNCGWYSHGRRCGPPPPGGKYELYVPHRTRVLSAIGQYYYIFVSSDGTKWEYQLIKA